MLKFLKTNGVNQLKLPLLRMDGVLQLRPLKVPMDGVLRKPLLLVLMTGVPLRPLNSMMLMISLVVVDGAALEVVVGEDLKVLEVVAEPVIRYALI
jgi:hypothetical protein